MTTFEQHNKFTKIVAVALMATGIAGLTALALLSIEFTSQSNTGLATGVLFGMPAIGLALGVLLWRRVRWALTAASIYFAVQLVAIHTPEFVYQLYAGIQFYVTINQGHGVFGLNLFALLVIMLAFRASRELRSAPNQQPKPTPYRRGLP